MIGVDLRMNESQFAYLEAKVHAIREWLDAGPHTGKGRGSLISVKVIGLPLYLHVRRTLQMKEEPCPTTMD